MTKGEREPKNKIAPCTHWGVRMPSGHWVQGTGPCPPNTTTYKVKTGDRWETVASTHGVDVDYLMNDLNFQTSDPYEINWYLDNYLGCPPAPDGINFMFSSGQKYREIHVPAPTPLDLAIWDADAMPPFDLGVPPAAGCRAHIGVHVQDSSGAAVQGASISVDGMGPVGTTDPGGNLDIGDVEPGTYTVEGTKVGFAPASASQEQPAPCGASTLYTLVLDPLHAKIDLAGVAEADKVTIGGLIVRRFDGNNAPRKKVTISMVALPAGCTANVILQSGSDKINIYDAAAAGNLIAINGAENRFPSASLPRDLWVEGINYSDTMRDIELSVDVEGATTRDDFVKLTALWLDKPNVVLSGTISAHNAKRDNYKNWTHAGNFDLKLQMYGIENRRGWGSEASSKVHPAGLNYPANDLKLERDMFIRYYTNGAVTYTREYSAPIPPGNDTGPAWARDDNPAPDDTIYDFDAPGAYTDAAAKDTVIRIRYNFKAFASITVEHQAVRCSEVTQYYVRFSQKQITDPSGRNWIAIDPPDIAGDKDARGGQTNVTRDLR